MKMIYVLMFILAISLLSACESLQVESSNDDTEGHPITEVWWWLDTFEDEHGEKTNIGTEDVAIIFGNDSTLSGIGVWKEDGTKGNELFGAYRSEPFKICVTSTRKGVPEGSRSEEFMLSLRSAETIQLASNRLVIILQNGSGRIHLKSGDDPHYQVTLDRSVIEGTDCYKELDME